MAGRPEVRRLIGRLVLLAGLVWAGGTAAGVAPASATGDAETIFSDNGQLLRDPAGTLLRLRLLGVERVRVFLEWSSVAPHAASTRRPAHFDPTDPAAYPASAWAPWDAIVRDSARDGIGVDLDVMGPAPRWAVRPGDHGGPHGGWEPVAAQYGAFVAAVAERYGGRWNPTTDSLDPQGSDDLPAVRFWSIWNEPNYGPTLAPQGVLGNLRVEHSPAVYRALLDAAWSSLQSTGHTSDTVLWGELAPRGRPFWGVFSGMKPLVFLRALFCVDAGFRRLSGRAATLRGCPARPASARAFRRAHPALFDAAGLALHLYMRWYPPDVEEDYDPNYASLAELGGATATLDRLERMYGSSRRVPVYDTEFGYITSPPKPDSTSAPFVSQALAGAYMNWAEYITWHSPRLFSYDQYLLFDPLPATAAYGYSGYASGLVGYGGRQKADYGPFRLPIYLPDTVQAGGSRLEVWGCVRPAHFAQDDTGQPQQVQIQFAGPTGAFRTLQTLGLDNPRGYFDTRVAFPGPGRVRLRWTYPSGDPLLPSAYAIYSRTVPITVR